MKNRHETAMHRPTVGLVVALAVSVALAGCGKGASKDDHAAEGAKHEEHAPEKKSDHGAEPSTLKLTREEAERAGIQVEPVKAQQRSDVLTVTATIRPDEDRLARVGPRVAGRITSAPARLGDSVRAGQMLATLDSVEVGEAHSGWVQSDAELRIAEAELKRIEPLAADEIIPKKDLLRARAERDKAAAAVRSAADRLRVLGGSPRAGGAAVSTFSVTAPFAGTITEKAAVLGELGDPGKPLFTVADLSRVWIQANLPEASLAKVRLGTAAKVSVPAYPGETFSGTVSYLGAGLNAETRTVAARIEVPNKDGRLKPEMFATATLEVGGDKRDVIALPDAAIVLMNGQPTVFVYEQGVYAARPVEAGERTTGGTLVTAGIRPGEQVVTAGAFALKAQQQKSQLGHGH